MSRMVWGEDTLCCGIGNLVLDVRLRLLLDKILPKVKLFFFFKLLSNFLTIMISVHRIFYAHLETNKKTPPD